MCTRIAKDHRKQSLSSSASSAGACTLNHHGGIASTAFIFRRVRALAASATTIASQPLWSSSPLRDSFRFQPPRSHRNHSPHRPSCVIACTLSHHVCIATTLFIAALWVTEAIAAEVDRSLEAMTIFKAVRLWQKPKQLIAMRAMLSSGTPMRGTCSYAYLMILIPRIMTPWAPVHVRLSLVGHKTHSHESLGLQICLAAHVTHQLMCSATALHHIARVPTQHDRIPSELLEHATASPPALRLRPTA